MNNSRIVASKLNEALSHVAEVLSKVQIEEIKIFISAGEWLLALETLCEFLHEYQFLISSATYKLLREVKSMMNLRLNILDKLKDQISN